MSNDDELRKLHPEISKWLDSRGIEYKLVGSAQRIWGYYIPDDNDRLMFELAFPNYEF